MNNRKIDTISKKQKDVKIEKKEGQSKENKNDSKTKKEKSIHVFKNINYLLLTEKGIDNINLKNTLVFVVNRKATKPEIKKEVEKVLDVKVEKVNTCIDRKGRKKAYIKLSQKYNAIDIATQLGMM